MRRLFAAGLAALLAAGSATGQNLYFGMTPIRDIDFEFFHPKPDTLSIFIVGDIMSHGKMLKSAWMNYCSDHPGAPREAHGSYDYSTFFKHIGDRIENADIAIGNMEFPLAGPPFTGYPDFSAPDSYPFYLAEAGFDVLLGANNHILDKGDYGLERTVQVCDRLEKETSARYTGISKSPSDDIERYPLMLETKGVKVAVVNFTYGTNYSGQKEWPKVNRMRRDDIRKALERATEQGADFVLVIPHWGIEYHHTHSAQQEDLARWMASEGADAIVGAHPHVVQDMQEIQTRDGRTVPVFYSLGNAVSNQNDLPARLEMCLTIRLVLEKGKPIRMAPPVKEFLWCTKPGMIEVSYSVVPVKEFLGKEDMWTDSADYRNMVDTYGKVKKAVNIQDN